MRIDHVEYDQLPVCQEARILFSDCTRTSWLPVDDVKRLLEVVDTLESRIKRQRTVIDAARSAADRLSDALARLGDK